MKDPKLSNAGYDHQWLIHNQTEASVFLKWRILSQLSVFTVQHKQGNLHKQSPPIVPHS